eukprot:TRINITY_DN1237_c0_g1_i1.p1 TRINITY_DN1237_c0_g1~~TRINITY_DN1237_c0_g1_i1.p1  ORF type:complete len:688 (-),score=87.51 TRINITY_DN1237_c0_g1_i1:341-2404(-)
MSEENRPRESFELEGSPDIFRPRSSNAIFDKLKEAATNVSHKIQTTKEFLSDKNLRKKGAKLVRKGVKKGARMVNRSIEQGKRAVGRGPERIQKLIESVQERLREQHWERQLVLQRDVPVDIQIGHKLYENAPQQLRTNLWLAFLERPELCEPLKDLYNERVAQTNAREQQIKVSSFRSKSMDLSPNDSVQKKVQKKNSSFLDQLWGIYDDIEEDSFYASTEDCDGTQDMSEMRDGEEQRVQVDKVEPNNCQFDNEAQQKEGTQEICTKQLNDTFELIKIDSGNLGKVIDDGCESLDNNGIIQQQNESREEHISQVSLRNESSQQQSQQSTFSTEQFQQQDTLIDLSSLMGQEEVKSIKRVSDDGSNLDQEEQDDWELVPDSEFNEQTGKFHVLPGGVQHSGPQTQAEVEQERIIMNPLMEVVFLRSHDPEEFQAVPEDSLYATLLQTNSQDGVEEVIARDINRTFPEVPQFELRNTQKSLFNVLKAYASQDLEVGYCQGMAFVAGLILMYLQEEPTFRLYCILMDPRYGIGLRKYYLPDLLGLQDELEKFDMLVRHYLPTLFEHLQEAGALAVLYAAPWYMTSYAACLPSKHAARIIDVMLITRSDDILHQLGLAILFELERALLMLDSMEQICNHIKTNPARGKSTGSDEFLKRRRVQTWTQFRSKKRKKPILRTCQVQNTRMRQ